MNLKRILSSTKTYFIILILAIAVLLITSAVSYKQIRKLQETADLVNHTLEVELTIERLFIQIHKLEALKVSGLLRQESDIQDKKVWNSLNQNLAYLTELTSDNNTQQKDISILKDYLDGFSKQLNKQSKSTFNNQSVAKNILVNTRDITTLVDKMLLIKDRMVAEEQRLMIHRRDAYDSQSILTPILSLFISIFSLGMFILAFTRIHIHKEKTIVINKQLKDQNTKLTNTELFLKSIYQSSDNIISHFIPIKDQDNTIIDFVFQYTSEALYEITGDLKDSVIGKSLLEFYPMTLENGLFTEMISCYYSGETLTHDACYIFDGKEKSIRNTIAKSGEGVTNTAWDTTSIKTSERKLVELNEKLNLQNTIFRDAENIAGIGSYIWDLQKDSATVSDNFYRILGHEPDSFSLTYKKYLEFVHPEDIDGVRDFIAKSTDVEKTMVHEHKIIIANGDLRYLLHNRHYLKTANELIAVGVVQDITDRVEAASALTTSNESLKASNTELESFNRVASHDLQEPLRKIQMFISRIEDTDDNILTDRSLAFFDKVKSAADRMQLLIQNLLALSRLQRIDTNLDAIDLNDVLADVKEELAQTIAETGATITADNLPYIAGILFEMEQVFTNILGNSLKYRNPSEPPKITISSEKLYKDEILESFLKTEKFYHKITFRDNGIGFDPAYADKIFQVFQRLHQKNEYSGTGIGLSICKKIIERHKGFIYAIGQPNAGTSFIIYIPAS